VKRRCPKPAPSVHGRPVERLAETMREVSDYRVALKTDLVIVAASVDAAEPEIAAGILDGERSQLAEFHELVLRRLAELPGVG
jgi:hypothetical protein